MKKYIVTFYDLYCGLIDVPCAARGTLEAIKKVVPFQELSGLELRRIREI